MIVRYDSGSPDKKLQHRPSERFGARRVDAVADGYQSKKRAPGQQLSGSAGRVCLGIVRVYKV